MVKYSALKGLYETEKTIGCGGFAKVKLATHLATGEKVAIKIMDKKFLGDDLHRVTLELQALKSLSHNNICQLYQVIDTATHFFLVMEYCSGGELFDHIVEKNRLTESESRTFFRQIVSAVAYLHSLGYAHRDLKPENVLLDKQQNLKLIDFGLCAKPEGGMENPLFTSCGSPTYAAPELILGQQYLGQEVDVWAMGVLLYALLTGSLPFDDLNIDNLYRKILNGKYEEPRYISRESRKLIRAMLQVDPKKRIKISDLLDHSWLTLGVLEAVDFRSKIPSGLDRDCVQVMAKFMDSNEAFLRTELNKWKFDYNTSTYFLLLNRKKNGLSLKLNLSRIPKTFEAPQNIPLIELPVNVTPNHAVKYCPKLTDALKSPSCVSPTMKNGALSPSSGPFLEHKSTRSESVGRKAVKRPRSRLLDDASPVPLKKCTPVKGTPSKTPESRKLAALGTETPGSARRMLGSLERSLYKVRHVLTPKKPLDSVTSEPAVLNNKDLCNVSTTQCHDPELVITELGKSLEKKGIMCKRKGFSLKGSLDPNFIDRFGGCSFELEICFIPNLGHLAPKQNLTPTKSILKQGILTEIPSSHTQRVPDNCKGFLVGIRRKRLKGDSWCYKKVCEQVLALTATGFSSPRGRDGVLESAV
ncbi:maternal embryonic leucine zipper kinase-like isoform X1 [Euwallacea similis]|uniref:maternal embryonic leucine zipper kinase-like isoform X1 n=1 Tax=Euwallacea similis TaxID=1736056 RepID=UPI00344F9304